MIRLAVIALALLAATPTLAEPITITIDNQGSQALTGIDAFPISPEDGSILQNNLGGSYARIEAGASTSFVLDGGDCGMTLLRIAVINETEQTASIDTCSQQTVVVSN